MPESDLLRTLRENPDIEKVVMAEILRSGDVQAAINSIPGARGKLGGRTLRRLHQ